MKILYSLCTGKFSSHIFSVSAGIIQDRLMSKNELIDFSKMPSLEAARSQVCAVLDSAGSSIVSQLNQSQQLLVSHLDKHVELQNKPQNEQEDS